MTLCLLALIITVKPFWINVPQRKKKLPLCHFLVFTTHLWQRLNCLIITRKTCFISRNQLHEFRQTGSRGVHVSLVIGEKWQCPQRRTGLMSHFNNAPNLHYHHHHHHHNNTVYCFISPTFIYFLIQYTPFVHKYFDFLTVVGLHT